MTTTTNDALEIILYTATRDAELVRERRHARADVGRHISLSIAHETKGGYSNTRLTGRFEVSWNWGKTCRTNSATKRARFDSFEAAQSFADSKWAVLLVWAVQS